MNFIREDLLIKVKDINTIPNEEGLYVLNTELDMIKLGTSIDLRNRIKQYKIKDNICYITCSGSKYRENAMFEFMKNKLDITPFCKREYFKYSRTSLDKIISLFGSCEDNYIMNGFNEEQVEELKKYILDSNEEHEKVLKEHTVKQDENVVEDNNNQFLCRYCNSSFSLKRTLQIHIKTSKRCIEKRPKIEIKCVWCNADFISIDNLETHYRILQVYKEYLYKDLFNSLSMSD